MIPSASLYRTAVHYWHAIGLSKPNGKYTYNLLYMRFPLDSRDKLFIVVKSTNQMIFVTEKERVLCAVRTESSCRLS